MRKNLIASSLVHLCIKRLGDPWLFVVIEEFEGVVVVQHIVQASLLYPAFELSLSVLQIVADGVTFPTDLDAEDDVDHLTSFWAAVSDASGSTGLGVLSR